MKAHDTFYVVVTTGAKPYALPYTAATTKAGALNAYRAVSPTRDRLPPQLRVVRIHATWEVKP